MAKRKPPKKVFIDLRPKLPPDPLANGINSVTLTKAASLVYPIIVTQLLGEISEIKACELLGKNVEEYRVLKSEIGMAVVGMLEWLPSPLILLMGSMKDLQK